MILGMSRSIRWGLHHRNLEVIDLGSDGSREFRRIRLLGLSSDANEDVIHVIHNNYDWQ